MIPSLLASAAFAWPSGVWKGGTRDEAVVHFISIIDDILRDLHFHLISNIHSNPRE